MQRNDDHSFRKESCEDGWLSLEMLLFLADRETFRYLCSLPHDNKLTNLDTSFFCLISYFIFKCAHFFLGSLPQNLNYSLANCSSLIILGRADILALSLWSSPEEIQELSGNELVKYTKPFLPLSIPSDLNLN